MSVRAMWKGVIRFADVRVPVKMYAAAEDRAVHFRLLHAKDLVPVKQRMVDSERGEPVSGDQTRRGLEIEPGVVVLLEPEELDTLTPPPSRDIDVTHFIPSPALGHAWLDRPYYLGPDGDMANYAAFVTALGNQRGVGLAHWVMRKKAYAGALFARKSHLMLMTLRHAEEVLELPEVRPSKSYQVARKEVALAEQLVSALEDVFDPETYHDAYRERVLQLIEHKARGEQVPSHRVEKKPPARALDAVLRDSVRLARERRSA